METFERPLDTEHTATAVVLPPETRAVIALDSSKTELDLRALAAKHVAIVEIKDRAGREQAHGAAMELMRARTTIERSSKEARDDATKFSKAVITEEKRLVAIVEPEEKRLKDLRDGWDDAEKARREAEAAAERARVLAITTRIADIKSYGDLAIQCRTSSRIKDLLDKMTEKWLAFNFEDDFEEFGAEAQLAFNATRDRLAALIDAKQAEEDERARIKAEQEAEAALLAAARAEIERQQAEDKARRDAEAAELQRQREAFEAEQAEKRAAFMAEMEALAEAKRAADAAVAAQEAELAHQREELAQKPDQPSIEQSSSAIETVAEMLSDDSVTVIPATVLVAAAAEMDATGITDGDVAYLPVTMEEPQQADPSDADVILIAARAVADAFGWTTADAINRLAAIDWQPA